MELSARHIEAFDTAERLLFHRDLCPYLDLKRLLPRTDDSSRQRFRELYTDFYQLRIGGLTDEFKDKYFELLFSPPKTEGRIDVKFIFQELCGIKNHRGSVTLPFSFVSKLVGMHDESSPIFDIHVSNFLGRKPPESKYPMNERIDWCLEFLESVRDEYSRWAQQTEVTEILTRLKQRDVALQLCHDVRLLDILVWKTGSKKLLMK